ncbi:cysteine desulfurase family protein [Polyangium sp. y55x31]|uniref:cysteine desulfurase family protein n=1 Tax=Polyangium sp. y55x31 TaxID=3042688 RepID=UPI0024830114|nr:cysteine desulfurase family protein [Polyangium sp. y55x31]MDI1481471.1 cysteine desulfurase family protein [Polyangium sp. y55x31]
MRVVYLDWNATSPPHPDVVAAMVEAATSSWGNPASVHGPGRRARSRVEDAREAVAALVGFDPRDVVLTSGGTEANNLALHHAFATASGGSAQPALVVGRIEHPSVVRFAEHLAARGVLVLWVDPEPSGRITPEAVAEAMDRAASAGATVRLVALQAVNHETGVIQPVAAVASLCRSRNALLHVDAVQAVGKLPRATLEGADLVSVAAHKIRGPKGIGALLTASSVRLSRLLYGGSQERGLRPGTQDPVAAAGFAVAAERARRTPDRYAELAPLRDRLQAELVRLGREAGAEPLPNGAAERAPHVTNLSFPGWRGEELCAALDLERVAVSSGSACSAGTAEPSPVLAAMVGEARALAAVRVSLGEETTADDVDEALARFARVLGRTRPTS